MKLRSYEDWIIGKREKIENRKLGRLDDRKKQKLGR